MVRNIKRLVALVVFLVATIFFLRWIMRERTYEAKCVYAYWKSNVDTNVVGEVVQPETERQLGGYTDYQRVAEESLSEFFTKRTTSLFLDYLHSSVNSPYDIAIVSNAFASIRFEITGNPVAVVALSSRSKFQDLSLDVLRFTLFRYIAFVEDGERNREEKSLAMLKNSIERKRREGEDASNLVARLEEASIAVQKYRQRISIVRHPFIVRQ